MFEGQTLLCFYFSSLSLIFSFSSSCLNYYLLELQVYLTSWLAEVNIDMYR